MEAVEPVSIDLSDYFVDNAAVIAIDGCMQRSLIEAGYLGVLTQHNLQKLDNYLQVTIDNRNLIFNLNTEKPSLVNEIEETEKLTNP